MRYFRLLLLLCGVLLWPVTGAAQPQGYVGLEAFLLEYDAPSADEPSAFPMVGSKLGIQPNENLSFEMRIASGLGSQAVQIHGMDTDVELNLLLGGYIRAGLPLTEHIYPYLTAGYSTLDTTVSVPTLDSGEMFYDEFSDASFGLGFDIVLDDLLVINVEYMDFMRTDHLAVQGVSLGIMLKQGF